MAGLLPRPTRLVTLLCHLHFTSFRHISLHFSSFPKRAAKIAANLGTAGRSERAEKGVATLGAAGCSERAEKGVATLGAAGCSERAEKTAVTKQAHAIQRLGAAMEQRSDPSKRPVKRTRYFQRE